MASQKTTLAAQARLPFFYEWINIMRIETVPEKPTDLPNSSSYTLLAVESGTMALFEACGQRISELSAGDLCVTDGTVRIRSGAAARKGAYGYAVAFRFVPLNEIAANERESMGAGDGGLLLNTRLHDSQAMRWVRELFALRNAAILSERYSAHALFQRLMVSVIEAGSAAMAPERLGFRDAVSATIARMEERPAFAWTVDRLAREAGCSVRQYARIFRSLTGNSPRKHLTGLRMTEAKRRMHGEEASLADISGDLGFADPFHFSRAFKRHEGLAPSVYARARRQGARIVAFQYLGELLALGLKPIGAPSQLMDCRYFIPRVRGIASTGASVVEPYLDRVRALEPELILTFDGHHYERYAGISDTLNLSWSLSPEERLIALANKVGKQEEAARWIRAYRKKTEEAAGRFGSGPDKVRTVTFIWTNGLPDTVQVYKETELIRDLGWRSPKAVEERRTGDCRPFKFDIPVGLLPHYAGDALFVVVSPDNRSRQQFERLKQSRVWSELDAVRRGRVYVLGQEWLRDDPISLAGQLSELQAIVEKPRVIR
ncbi:helix-turn-helix domain-containing protein [Cohnella sp. GCM10012308]|uniref:helix-turn-helix domain-containing protein n=1 Tax=Cohnella sp. GCM10012308 TaxID=3317329 RepID=UPI003617C7B1